MDRLLERVLYICIYVIIGNFVYTHINNVKHTEAPFIHTDFSACLFVHSIGNKFEFDVRIYELLYVTMMIFFW